MPILMQCPGCDKRYRVREDLIGKRVKCECGTVMTVPRESVDASRALEIDEEAEQELLDQKWPSGSEASENRAPSADHPHRPHRPRETGSRTWRIVIGVLCILYGTATTVALILIVTKGGLGALLLLAVGLVLSVSIVVSGVLILMRHEHGPACAGLCCLFLCFFPLWYLLLLLLSAFSAKEMLLFVCVLIMMVVCFAVPAVIFTWCLKQEAAKKESWEPPL